ncbi:hypothetical protein BBK14_03395 [Parafrankia soli]|uniref:Uncharacterized protein n=1 Tax=Parafrankia soli TaxID=2599596 RepID=A0A1S1Q540_9ACTN|nr:hypothetical protein BBK14_03395 [Parafrankia soli]
MGVNIVDYLGQCDARRHGHSTGGSSRRARLADRLAGSRWARPGVTGPVKPRRGGRLVNETAAAWRPRRAAGPRPANGLEV